MGLSKERNVMLGEILREIKASPSAYLRAARQIETGGFKELKPLNVAILATFTADVLRPYLVVEGAARNLLVRPYFAPFNQLEQQVLDGAGPLYESKPDVVVIATRLDEITPNLSTRFMTLSPTDIDGELARIEVRLQNLVEGIRRFTTATVFVFNYASPTFLAAGLADPFLEPSQTAVVQRANERIAEVCRKSVNVYVFDHARMVCEFGLRQCYDPRLLYLGRIPFGIAAQIETSRRLARTLRAVSFPPCKCLVVDLDNTLWGGVLGEDGLGSIALGEDYPGNVYKDFQRRLLSLRDQGVLLAVASKNNEAEVLEVFRRHPDCVLKVEDFAALQVHWQDKTMSLAAIAKELNISTDALAFFDDSPVERQWVRSQMPEVTVIEVPESPLDFTRAVEESGAFDQLVVSTEDLKRHELYQREREHKRLWKKSMSLEEFLQQLGMTVTVGYVNGETLPRVAQLVAKTNQFNLTTRRRTASELYALVGSGAVALWLRVEDRFGDSGLVGTAIAIPGKSGQWTIDTFLLSCRVVGRQVESVLLGILSHIVLERGGKVLFGEYTPTPQNGIASGFYPAVGFEPVDSAGRLWRWNLSRGEIPLPKFITVDFEDDKRHRG